MSPFLSFFWWKQNERQKSKKKKIVCYRKKKKNFHARWRPGGTHSSRKERIIRQLSKCIVCTYVLSSLRTLHAYNNIIHYLLRIYVYVCLWIIPKGGGRKFSFTVLKRRRRKKKTFRRESWINESLMRALCCDGCWAIQNLQEKEEEELGWRPPNHRSATLARWTGSFFFSLDGGYIDKGRR